VVNWPSRDIDAVRVLLRHGFTWLTIAAVRVSGCEPVGDAPGPRSDGDAGAAGVRIRRAAPADIDKVVRFGLDLLRFDAHFDLALR
jgi:hypothetical protein